MTLVITLWMGMAAVNKPCDEHTLNTEYCYVLGMLLICSYVCRFTHTYIHIFEHDWLAIYITYALTLLHAQYS